MTINPYQSPLDPPSDSPDEEVLAGEGRSDASAEIAIDAGFRWVAAGYSLLLVTAMVATLLLLARGEPFRLHRLPAARPLAFAALAGLMAALWGTVRWASVSQPNRLPLSIALALQSLAMVALGRYVSVSIEGPLGRSLLHFFGASAYAMLCTSQAIVGLAAQAWLRRRGATRGTVVLTGAVIAFAVSASLFSALALDVLDAAGEFPLFSAIVIADAAIALQLAGLLAWQTGDPGRKTESNVPRPRRS